ASRVQNADSIVHTEMPFFSMIDKSKCLEGVVDLAIFNPTARQAFILDWKTNREDSADVEELRRRYLPQMAAYWRAIAQLTGAATGASIYPTAAGRLIIYTADELATEWDRLSKVSDAEMQLEISVSPKR